MSANAKVAAVLRKVDAVRRQLLAEVVGRLDAGHAACFCDLFERDHCFVCFRGFCVCGFLVKSAIC